MSLSASSASLSRWFSHIDWPLLISAFLIACAGLITMHSFGAENAFFERQVIWISVALVICFGASLIDYRFLRKTAPVAIVFVGMIGLLLLVFFAGDMSRGAQRGFNLGFFSIHPSELAKLTLIILLAKYFARRHVEIAHVRHIIVSGLYAFALFALVFFQPDLGTAIVIGLIWFGMVLVAGISKKHLAVVFIAGFTAFASLWFAPVHTLLGTEEPLLQDYQKERILSFLHPLADIQGAGYNAYQSMVAVGSGELTGRGVGFGTQSKLQFLPEYQTDFIFAAFAEEWGYVGILLLFGLFSIVIWRTLSHAHRGASNFETLFALGFSILLMSHFIIHIGFNLGLMPVTGTALPFMSYGGTHLVVEFLGLGMLMGMRRYERTVVRGADENEVEV